MSIDDFVMARRPIHASIARGEWTRLRRYLTEEVALPSQENLQLAMQKCDGQGLSPLMLAVDCFAEVALLRALVATGVDPDQEDNHGNTVWKRLRSSSNSPEAKSPQRRQLHGDILKFLSKLRKLCQPRLEFGICGLDRTFPKENLKKLLDLPEGLSPDDCVVVLVAAFQLAYQGFPWAPAKGYEPEPSLEGRRYPNGETYPAWHEIQEMIAEMPGIPLSFHLNESQKCPYVSSLLRGDAEALKLVDVLCCKKPYHARHIQININATGVPSDLFMMSEDEEKSHKSALQIAELARRYSNTLFLIGTRGGSQH